MRTSQGSLLAIVSLSEEFEPGALKLGDDLVLMRVGASGIDYLSLSLRQSTIRPRLLVMLCQIYESLTLLSRRLVIYLLLYRVILGHSLRLNGLPVTCLLSGQSSLKQPNQLGQMRNPGIQPESTVTGTDSIYNIESVTVKGDINDTIQ